MPSTPIRPLKFTIREVTASAYEIAPDRLPDPVVLKGAILVDSTDPEQRIGIWEASTGRVNGFRGNEMFYVLEGSATLAFDDGTRFDITAGDLISIPDGVTHDWTVHEPVRKIFVSNGPR